MVARHSDHRLVAVPAARAARGPTARRPSTASPATRAAAAGRAKPLGAELERRLYQCFRRAGSIDEVARRFGLPPRRVERAVARMRAARLIEMPLDYVPSAEFAVAFEDRRLERAILAPAPGSTGAEAGGARRDGARPSAGGEGSGRRGADLPAYLAGLYETPLLRAEEERHLFRKMNYLKYKASRLRERLDRRRPRKSLLDAIEHALAEAQAIKNAIIRANLRLVVSLARRYLHPMQTFFELVSDGNMSLMRAVEKFDYARGFRFSTYASWAIMKNFARTIPAEYRQHERFRTGQEEALPVLADPRSAPPAGDLECAARREDIERLLGCLDDRERLIIRRRFGLDASQKAQTLHEVGQSVGVTKERVRQIEARALEKLRRAAAEQRLGFPEN